MVSPLSCVQGRIKASLGPGAMTYCRAPHHNNYIYCQDPALTVLSVLSLFNVSLFVLCLSTWLCLFVFAMFSSCPTFLFPLVAPPCLVLVQSLFAWLCSPDPCVLCCFILLVIILRWCWIANCLFLLNVVVLFLLLYMFFLFFFNMELYSAVLARTPLKKRFWISMGLFPGKIKVK